MCTVHYTFNNYIIILLKQLRLFPILYRFHIELGTWCLLRYPMNYLHKYSWN